MRFLRFLRFGGGGQSGWGCGGEWPGAWDIPNLRNLKNLITFCVFFENSSRESQKSHYFLCVFWSSVPKPLKSHYLLYLFQSSLACVYGLTDRETRRRNWEGKNEGETGQERTRERDRKTEWEGKKEGERETERLREKNGLSLSWVTPQIWR